MGYRGELMVSFKSRTASWIITILNKLKAALDRVSKRSGIGIELYSMPVIKPPYNIGDKIAQIQINCYPTVVWNEVDKLGESERGTGGHGSTGK